VKDLCLCTLCIRLLPQTPVEIDETMIKTECLNLLVIQSTEIKNNMHGRKNLFPA